MNLLKQTFQKKNIRNTLALIVAFYFSFSPSFSETFYTKHSSLIKVDSAQTTNNIVTVFAYKTKTLNLVFSGGDGGIMDVYKMNTEGKLTPLASYELYNKKGPARGIVADNVGGKDFLFVGNKGGNAVEVFEIYEDGSLKRVFLLKDTEDTFLGIVITLQVVHMKKAAYLFVGGLEESPGLSCFKIANDGSLAHVQSVKDNELIHTDGIIGMFVHKIKGKTFLSTGGFMDNGVSSFRVYDNGCFKNVSNADDNKTDRFLTGTYPINGVTLGENHYVIVGHRHPKYYKRLNFIKKKDFVYHGDGVTVFKMNDKGELTFHSVLINNDSTKLAGQTRIEVLKINESEAIVTIATRDDNSIQVCVLGQDGNLTPTVPFMTGYPVYYGMTSMKIGQNLIFLAGSVDYKLKKLYSYKIQF